MNKSEVLPRQRQPRFQPGLYRDFSGEKAAITEITIVVESATSAVVEIEFSTVHRSVVSEISPWFRGSLT